MIFMEEITWESANLEIRNVILMVILAISIESAPLEGGYLGVVRPQLLLFPLQQLKGTHLE